MLLLLNILAACITSLLYVRGVPFHGISALWAGIAIVSNAAMVTFAFGLLAQFLIYPSGKISTRTGKVVTALLWTLFHLVLFIDTQIWGIFKYHINGMVLNVVFTPGGLETFQLDAPAILLPTFGFAAMFAGQWWLLSQREQGWPLARLRKPVLIGGFSSLLCFIVADKTLFAWADARQTREITSRSRMLPLYQPVTVKRLRKKFTGQSVESEASVGVTEGLSINYPKIAPRCPEGAPRPNILIIAVDSLRSDQLNPVNMPILSAWSSKARVFEDHASGGNATRFGVFSLLYGLAGPYWFNVYGDHLPPAMLVELQRLGYDMRVLTTARQDFPEFRSTVWVTMNDRIKDRWGAEPKWRNDELVSEEFDRWLGGRAAQTTPFFAYLMLDSPHQNYDWPKDKSPFTPYMEKVSYLKSSSRPPEPELEKLKNSYFNSVRHADSVLGKILETIERRSLSENTLIVITGDHGEEFFENGFYGHTSNYTRSQVQVPFVMAGPGVTPGQEKKPSSHLDLAVTVLEMLGADPSIRKGWAQGENLLQLPEKRNRMIGGWQESALWCEDGVFYIPLEGHRGLASPMGWDWKRHPDGDAFTRRHIGDLTKMAKDLREFLK